MRFVPSARPLALICVSVALPLLAADKLAARVGLWETTTTVTTSGIAMPAQALAGMPPAQRAQMEQVMKQIGATGPRTSKDRSCVTDKDLQEGAFRKNAAQNDAKCKYTTVTSTAKRQEFTFQCDASEGGATGRMTIDVLSDTHVKGTMQMKSSQISMDSSFDSQWLGASCPAAGK